MIKSLLTVPSAVGLFQATALHSAPLNFGDQSVKTANAVGSLVTSHLNCTSMVCMRQQPVSAILAAQDALYDPNSPIYAAGMVEGISSISEPIHTIVDGILVAADFGMYTEGAKPLPISVPTLLTTVKNEACQTIDAMWVLLILYEYDRVGILADQVLSVISSTNGPLPAEAFEYLVQGILGDRAPPVLKSMIYDPSKRTNDTDAVRDSLEALGTDYIW